MSFPQPLQRHGASSHPGILLLLSRALPLFPLCCETTDREGEGQAVEGGGGGGEGQQLRLQPPCDQVSQSEHEWTNTGKRNRKAKKFFN